MKALTITVMWILGWTSFSMALSSCSAEYLSPRTGIKYRFEVPLDAFVKPLPIQVSPTK